MAAGLLGTAVSGLQSFQRGIATAGHNISNANTEGYSRQRVELGTRPPSVSGAGYIGNGVQTQSIERMFDSFAATNLRNATSSSSQYDTLALYAGRVSNLLGDEQAGLNIGLESFFNAVQDVSADPASIPARQLMLSEGESLAARFQNIDAQLNSMADEINNSVTNTVATINSISAAIVETNRAIADAGDPDTSPRPNDLLDQRDNLVNQLAQLVSVTTIEQDNGALNVFVGTGQALVTGTVQSKLEIVRNNFDSRYPEIAVNNGAASVVITDNITGGKLGATLEFQDNMLNPALNALGRVAVTLGIEFNRQHNLGMDLDGAGGTDFFSVAAPFIAPNANNIGSAAVTVSFDSANISNLTVDDYELGFDGASWSLRRVSDNQVVPMAGAGPYFADGLQITIPGGAVAGDRFLIQPTRSGGAGMDTLLGSPREIAAAAPAAGPAPGDNSNALLLAGLQVAQSMENGTTNFQGAYGQLISEMGTRTRSAQITSEAQAALLTQAQANRDAISGVNLDEEAADLIRFQQAYQAIAQIIAATDTLFQTLLGAVGR